MAILLVLFCSLSAVSGQWLEKTIALSDTFGGMWPAAVYYVPSSNCVYVAGDDGVLVVDATTNARVARIVMDEPMFMAFDSHGNRVYMSGRESLSAIDPMAHQVLAQFHVGSNPTRLCYNPAANKVYCLTGSRRDTVAVFDCSTNSVLARIWVGRTDYDYGTICCNPVGNKVYVPSDDEGTVAVIDGAGDSLMKSLDVGDYPAGLVYCPVSNKLYCSATQDDEVAVFDAGPDTLLKLIEVDVNPLALGYSPASNKVYCGDGNGYIHVIDCYTDTILASLGPVDGNPTFFLFDSVDNRVFCFPDYGQSFAAISGTGDTVVGEVKLSVDAYEPNTACYDPQQNRIYVRGRSSEDVYVVDAAGLNVVAAIQMNARPNLGCYVEPHDKFYASDEESGLITVIDCSTDSLVRRIFTPGWELGRPVYSLGSNKLYYGASSPDGRALLVVDCALDSFVGEVPMNVDGAVATVYNPAMNRIYWARAWIDSTIAVVDCERDSVVAELLVRGYPTALAWNPDSNRVYCTTHQGDSTFVSAIDCARDSVIGTVSVHAGSSSYDFLCYIPTRGLVVATGPDTSFVVVDGAARQVLQTVPLSDRLWGGYFDRASNKLYGFMPRSDLAVIDCGDMSFKARLRLAEGPGGIAFDTVAERVYVTSPDGHCISLVDGRTNRFLGLMDAGDSPGDITWVPQHRKMYVVDQRGQAVLVVRDTSLAGVCENSSPSVARAVPTIVHGVLFLPRDMTETAGVSDRVPRPMLLDATGRKVMDLSPGANDVRRLAPGVYFVCRGPSAVGHQLSAINKVVITR